MPRNDAYRLLAHKIEQARRSGAKELALEGSLREDSLKLSQLPETLGQLDQLERLSLARNQLTELPASISLLTHLQYLDLSNNQLTRLPNAFGRLIQLQSLNLSSNSLTTLPAEMGQLTQLRSLNLSVNNLQEVPRWIGDLTQLQSLNLSHNHFTDLPDVLGKLTQLHSLDLSTTWLTELPISLGKLEQLQSLDLACVQNMTLPTWLGLLARLTSLDISYNNLTALPDWLRQFTQLQSLQLALNKLTALPDWLGDLIHLKSLDLYSNELTTLPQRLEQLTALETLDLRANRLQQIPEWIGALTSLNFVMVHGNQLTDLPDSFAGLKNLTALALGYADLGNPFGTLPQSVRGLKKLSHLWASKCNIQSLPDWLLDLQDIKVLDLSANPLNPELAAAYKEGLDAVKRYLRELAKGTKKRYEAKLLILGDGNEGKTCVSRAIRNLPFQPQVTTRGVDVEQWTFEHPDHRGDVDRHITLNIWDFEGQEINHQTHQFFLSTQALYILVFKCRDQFLMDRAEYWLDTIRARAPKAKVAIVIAQSEERTPYVPQDKLYAQYGDLLAAGKWLFAVGCKDNSGITELQEALKRWAADLEFMGRDWPTSYGKVEEAIKQMAKDGLAHINRGQLSDIFKECKIEEGIFSDVAASMSTLGVVTQFSDCPDLRDFVVLQPQWLTKAISEIMEDRQLDSDKGEIGLRRMEDIWENKGYAGLFVTFHNCMKEFELCYDLEDASRSCLLPLRFGYEKPEIPWSNTPDIKERRVEYKLKIRPPMGLMSRFIVKTHHMIVMTPEHPKGVYWHNGVFLRTGAGPLASEALCEFDSDDRKLRIQVRAAFPQNLIEQIHAYVKAVFSFFTGMEAERSYGCIRIDEQTGKEETCQGVHSESRIYSAIRKQRVLDCEYEFHDVNPQKLIWGFSSFGEYVLAKVASIEQLRSELDKKPEWAETLTHDIGRLLGWVEENRTKMDQLLDGQSNLLPEIKQEAELKLHEYLAYTSQMLDDRDHSSAPGIISIGTMDRSKWSPLAYFEKTYLITPFCECDGNIHACEDAQIAFVRDREWWRKTAPWIARATKVLSVGLQLAFSGMPLALGDDVFDVIKNDVKFMNELSKHMELKGEIENTPAGADEILHGKKGKDMRQGDRESQLTRTALARLLEEIAPTSYRARQWGSLRRVMKSDNSYRWLCELHAPQ